LDLLTLPSTARVISEPFSATGGVNAQGVTHPDGHEEDDAQEDVEEGEEEGQEAVEEEVTG
jgi:hypothetical protein